MKAAWLYCWHRTKSLPRPGEGTGFKPDLFAPKSYELFVIQRMDLSVSIVLPSPTLLSRGKRRGCNLCVCKDTVYVIFWYEGWYEQIYFLWFFSNTGHIIRVFLDNSKIFLIGSWGRIFPKGLFTILKPLYLLYYTFFQRFSFASVAWPVMSNFEVCGLSWTYLVMNVTSRCRE